MNFQSKRFLRNAFISRIRRHASMATTFRVVDQMHESDRAVGRSTDSPLHSGIVQATLPVDPITLPDAQRVKPHLVDRPILSQDEHLMYQASTDLASVEQISAGVDHQEEAVQAQDDKAADIKGWQRLKAIFRKHQDKADSAGTPDSPAESESAPVQRKTMEQDSKIKPTKEQPSKTEPAQGLEKRSNTENPAPKQAASPTVSEDSPPSNQSSIATDFTPETNESPGTSRTQAKVTSPQATTASKPRIQMKKEPEAVPNPGDLLADDDPVSETGTPVSAPIQALPLEAVWPVQRLEEPSRMDRPIEEGRLTTIEDHPPLSLTEPQPAKSESGDAVPKTLRELMPGQPDASAIEIITSQHPRPVRFAVDREIAAQPNDETSLSSSNEFTNQTHVITDAQPVTISADTVHRSIATQEHDFDDVSDKGSKLSQSTVETTRQENALQRLAAESESDPGEKEKGADPDLVQTEIGPLPADLWDLLGQSPPIELEIGDNSPKNAPDSSGRETSVMPAISAAEVKLRSSGEIPQASEIEPTNIQREEFSDTHTIDMHGSTSEPVMKATELIDDQETRSLELDMDELSRRVFVEIKRRLIVEWERSRCRT